MDERCLGGGNRGRGAEMFPCPKATSVGSLVLQVAVITSSEPMRPFDIMTDLEQERPCG